MRTMEVRIMDCRRKGLGVNTISRTKKILKWEPKYTTLESFKDSYNHFIKEDDNVSNKSVHQTKIKSLILRYAPLFL